ncbi:MAG: CDIF630_02480 family spore surface protein [Cellulosilyticaceae bacterium]
MKKVDNVLTGKGNQRLGNTESFHEETTAAITDAKEVLQDTQVTVPSELNIINAKDWVDDGSQL